MKSNRKWSGSGDLNTGSSALLHTLRVAPGILRALFIVSLVLISAPAQAIDLFEGWDTADKSLYAVSVAATAADMHYTNVFLRDRDRHENNAVLGTRPSGAQLAAWGVGVCVVRYFAADFLQGNWRKAFLVGCAAIDIEYVRRNTVKFDITLVRM